MLTPEENALVEKVGLELSKKGRTRTALPGWGRLHIDRALPFLCVYRRPIHPDAGMDKLLVGESSFMVVPGDKRNNRLVLALLKIVVETIGSQFGAFLIVETWSSQKDEGVVGQSENPISAPDFHIFHPTGRAVEMTVRTLEQSLRGFRFNKQKSNVEISKVRRMPSIKGLSTFPILKGIDGVECQTIGLQIRPVFRDQEEFETCEIFPALFRQFRRGLSHAIRKTLFKFTEHMTTQRPPHFQAMGPRALTKMVWEVDRRLSGICDNFDYLFQVTPINSHAAWLAFQKSGFQKDPEFHYRPLPYDPSDLKRQLFQIPVEQVEDPALAYLFRDKQDELDRMISLMGDCNTKRFLPGSIQIFGQVDEKLAAIAQEILQRISPRSRGRKSLLLSSKELATKAEEEILHYRGIYPGFSAVAQVRDDVPNGFWCQKENYLLVQKPKYLPIALKGFFNMRLGFIL